MAAVLKLFNRFRPVAGLTVAVAALAGLAGCASTGGPLGLSPAQEDALGKQEHPKIVAAFGGELQDPEVTGYVERITQRLIAASDQPDTPIKITVLDSPIVNAMALPGHVYVTRGLLALANSEAELAGVMGHELGHVYQRHTAKRVSRGNLAQIGAVLGAILTGNAETAQTIGQAAQLYVLNFTREQEYEADQVGVRLLARSGYSPIAEAYFLNTLGRWSNLQARITGQRRPPEFLSSHPNSENRVRRAAREAQLLNENGAATSAEIGRDRYLGVIDGLLYGEDAYRQGFIRGDDFIHPDLGFAFTVPNGFELRNTANAVLAQSRQTGARMQFTLASAEETPRQIIEGPLSQQLQIDFRPVQEGLVAGRPAAAGSGVLRSQQGTADVAAYVIKWEGTTNYLFLWVTPPAQTRNLADAINRSVRSLREVDPNRVGAPPRRIVDVVDVRPGDTPAGLARNMAAFPSYREEHFRVINGIGDQEPVKAGEKVKLIR